MCSFLFLEVSELGAEQQYFNEMVGDLGSAAETIHKKPQDFIFRPRCSAQGQDWEVKRLLFLSDHFFIWTPLVLVCAKLPSVHAQNEQEHKSRHNVGSRVFAANQ